MYRTDAFSSPPYPLMLENVDLLYVGGNEYTPPSQDIMILGLTVSQAAEYAEAGLNVKCAQTTLFGQRVGEDTLYIQVKVRKRGINFPGLSPFAYNHWWLEDSDKVNVLVSATDYHFEATKRTVLYLKKVEVLKKVDRTEERLARLEKALSPEKDFSDNPTRTNFRRSEYRRGDTMVVDGHTYVIGHVERPEMHEFGSWKLRLDQKFQRSVYVTI